MNIHVSNAADTRIRPATTGDAEALCELINFAGEGLPLHLWKKMAEPGETAWDVGRRRARRDEGSFSYRNSVTLEAQGAVAAALIGYPLAEPPEAVDYGELPPMFVPLQQLEDLVPNSWYVNVLAAYPEWRDQGFGARLLDFAEAVAADTNRDRMSIIVSDANDGAWRLYERCGYTFTAQRPMVKEDWENPGENWVLLTKEI